MRRARVVLRLLHRFWVLEDYLCLQRFSVVLGESLTHHMQSQVFSVNETFQSLGADAVHAIEIYTSTTKGQVCFGG